MTLVDERSSSRHPGCGCGGGCGSGTCSWTGAAASAGLERTRFYPRQIVTPDDLTQDQIYVRDKLRRHNRLLHGWGLVCGLVVERCAGSNPGTTDPCRVRITSGYALDPYGNEIVVPAPEVVDLCTEDMTGGLGCLPHDDPWCRPVETSRSGTFFLAVRFRERAIRPVHAPTGCSCADAGCENSRYRDEVEFRLLPELPDHYGTPCPERFDPCDRIDDCPGCPASGWVLLATVSMTGDAVETVTGENRRHVMSLARACLDCSDDRRDRRELLGGGRRLIGVGATTPDAMVRLDAVVDGRGTVIEIPVADADLRGKPALEVATAWAGVPLFDTDDPSRPRFDASWLFAHSPMEGTWTVESAADLSARLGRPVIDTATYPQRLQTLRDLLEQPGRSRLDDVLLGNVDRLDRIAPDMIKGVGAATAAALLTIGIDSAADLLSANLQDPQIPDAARPHLVAVRDALGRE